MSWASASRHAALRYAAILALCVPGLAVMAQDRPKEAEVKAAYLLNFGRFVRWPAGGEATRPFVMCVLGRDAFGDALDDTFAGENVSNRPTSVRRLDDAASAAQCDILYVGLDLDRQLASVLRAVSSSPTLTVSDLPDFIRRGGMIQFVRRAERVRFQLSIAAAQRAGLEPSADLSRVAELVTDSRGGN